MKFVAVALATAFGLVYAKETLVRRRNLENEAVAWKPAQSRNEYGADTSGFFRGEDWRGTPTYYSKSSKSPKSSKSNGLQSPKGTKSSKGPKGGHRPPPHPPSKDCPEFDFEDTCTEGSGNANECSIHSTCKPACVPKFCKLPDGNPHKVHAYDDRHQGDRYVKLGSVCGYFHYVEGMRHDVEVCCDVDEERRVDTGSLEEDTFCVSCSDCKYPQKVNDACCKIAGVSDMGRDGDYSEACPGDLECCKCGPFDISYKCIDPETEVCDTSMCPAPPVTTTPPPPLTTTAKEVVTTTPKASETTTTEAMIPIETTTAPDFCPEDEATTCGSGSFSSYSRKVCCVKEDSTPTLNGDSGKSSDRTCNLCGDCDPYQIVDHTCCSFEETKEMTPSRREQGELDDCGSYRGLKSSTSFCCKCGGGDSPGDYICVEKDEDCNEETCFPTSTTSTTTTTTAPLEEALIPEELKCDEDTLLRGTCNFANDFGLEDIGTCCNRDGTPQCTKCDECDFPQILNPSCCNNPASREDGLSCGADQFCCKCNEQMNSAAYKCVDAITECTECLNECTIDIGGDGGKVDQVGGLCALTGQDYCENACQSVINAICGCKIPSSLWDFPIDKKQCVSGEAKNRGTCEDEYPSCCVPTAGACDEMRTKYGALCN